MNWPVDLRPDSYCSKSLFLLSCCKCVESIGRVVFRVPLVATLWARARDAREAPRAVREVMRQPRASSSATPPMPSLNTLCERVSEWATNGLNCGSMKYSTPLVADAATRAQSASLALMEFTLCTTQLFHWMVCSKAFAIAELLKWDLSLVSILCYLRSFRHVFDNLTSKCLENKEFSSRQLILAHVWPLWDISSIWIFIVVIWTAILDTKVLKFRKKCTMRLWILVVSTRKCYLRTQTWSFRPFLVILKMDRSNRLSFCQIRVI